MLEQSEPISIENIVVGWGVLERIESMYSIIDNTLQSLAANRCRYSSTIKEMKLALAITFLSTVANHAAEIKCDLVG